MATNASGYCRTLTGATPSQITPPITITVQSRAPVSAARASPGRHGWRSAVAQSRMGGATSSAPATSPKAHVSQIMAESPRAA